MSADGKNKNKQVVSLGGYFLKWLKLTSVAFMKTIAMLAITSGLAAIAFFVYLLNALPTPTPEAMQQAPESTRILDRNGELLYEVFGEVKRTKILFSDIPEHLKKATIAIEDKDFYRHFGFDILSIIRAFRANYIHGGIKQGASTITQQLARTVFLDNEPTYERKIKEIVMAVKIEWRYSKDEILGMYLNNMPYGSNAYGVEAASEIYFGKHARELDLGESAYLAAMLKAPSAYSPYGPNADILHSRAQYVIDRMGELEILDATLEETAQARNAKEFKRIPVKINAPHFVFYIIDRLTEEYGEEKVRQGGMIVYTSLDLALQRQAEKIVTEQGQINDKKYQADNASLVALDPRSGEILAMVGSRDYFKPGDGEFNVALSPRQPGSSFKPYVYATAMTNGLNPATMIMDVSTNFANDNYGVDYIPRNYSGRHYGPVSVRQALAGSLNVPAVKALILTGIDESIDTAERLGLTTLKDRQRFGPAIVLGGAEVKLLEHTAGLGALGNGGIKEELRPILKIIDLKKDQTYAIEDEPGVQAVDAQAAYLITDILSDTQARTFIFGRGRNLSLEGRQVAVKTGTTQDFRDAWTIGYTPSLAVGVWVGNNDNSPMKDGADGSVVAAPIWHEFMIKTLASTTAEKFARPDGIVELTVDRLTGKLPTKLSPSTKKEIFASYNAPKEKDNAHLVVKTDGLAIKTTVIKSEKPDDPLWESAVRRWAVAAGYLSNINTADQASGGQASPIVFRVPEKITQAGWELSVDTARALEVTSTQIFIDDKLVVNDPSGKIHYTNLMSLNDGTHRFTVKITTAGGDIYTLNRVAEVDRTPQLAN